MIRASSFSHGSTSYLRNLPLLAPRSRTRRPLPAAFSRERDRAVQRDFRGGMAEDVHDRLVRGFSGEAGAGIAADAAPDDRGRFHGGLHSPPLLHLRDLRSPPGLDGIRRPLLEMLFGRNPVLGRATALKTFPPRCAEKHRRRVPATYQPHRPGRQNGVISRRLVPRVHVLTPRLETPTGQPLVEGAARPGSPPTTSA